MTSSRGPSRDAVERPITTRRSLMGGAALWCWRPRPQALGTKMAAPDDGVRAFSFDEELLFPVCEITTADGATVTAAILNAETQSACRLLCQMNAVAMTTTMTHSATPTATVALLWTPPSISRPTSVVDSSSVISDFPPTSPFDVETSASQAQQSMWHRMATVLREKNSKTSRGLSGPSGIKTDQIPKLSRPNLVSENFPGREKAGIFKELSGTCGHPKISITKIWGQIMSFRCRHTVRPSNWPSTVWTKTD